MFVITRGIVTALCDLCDSAIVDYERAALLSPRRKNHVDNGVLDAVLVCSIRCDAQVRSEWPRVRVWNCISLERFARSLRAPSVQPAVARGPSAEERVLAHLARVNSADRASLARSLNLAELYLRNVLKRLERDNQIVKTADGVFQLAKSLETAGVGGSFQPDSA
jgi:hypothetical protein